MCVRAVKCLIESRKSRILRKTLRSASDKCLVHSHICIPTEYVVSLVVCVVGTRSHSCVVSPTTVQIAHCDLKPENFLYETDAADSKVKMIDFGLSKYLKPRMYFTQVVGTCTCSGGLVGAMRCVLILRGVMCC